MVLGTQQYDGSLIASFGFEGNNQTRFFIPISIGSTESNSAFVALGRHINKQIDYGSDRDTESILTVNAGGKFLNQMQMKPIGIIAVKDVLNGYCQEETSDEVKKLCNEQMILNKNLFELFSSIDNLGFDGMKNPLVNGTVGINGLGLPDIPWINVFMIFQENEPESRDY